MKTGLRDLNVLITGASGGIGAALAEVFLGEGCHLSLHAGRSRAEELARRYEGKRAEGQVVGAWEADVRDVNAVSDGVAAARERLGRIDVCVVNAGIWPTESTPLHEQEAARIREVIEVNLMGAIWTSNAFMRALAASGPRADGRGASLCFVGSTAGRFGEAGHAEYAATKAAMVGLLRSLKNEIVHLDPYGRVNLVEPGWTVTPMAAAALEQPGLIRDVVATMPLRQLARAEDIARAVAVLSSPFMSRHVSGQHLTVAGGMEGRQLWRADDIDEPEVRSRLQRGD